MTRPATESATETQTARRPWVRPRLTRLRAGSASEPGAVIDPAEQ